MSFSLPQQDPSAGFCIPRSAATPQHGQKAHEAAKPKEPRTFQPRRGHS